MSTTIVRHSKPFTHSLANECTVSELHDWLISIEERIPTFLRRHGINPSAVLAEFHDLPEVRACQVEWENERPFPSDEQLIVMIGLLCRDRSLDNIDETALECATVVLSLMAFAEPISELVWLDISQRVVRFDERITLVEVDA